MFILWGHFPLFLHLHEIIKEWKQDEMHVSK